MANIMELVEKKAAIYITNVSGKTVMLELHRPGADTKSLLTKIPPIKKWPIPLSTIIPYNILEHDIAAVHTWINKRVFGLLTPKEAKKVYSANPDMEQTVIKLVNDANTNEPFQPRDIGLRTRAGALEQAKAEMGKKDYSGEVGQQDAYQNIYQSSQHGGPNGDEMFRLGAEERGVPPKIRSMILSLSEDESLKGDVLMKLKVMDEDELPDSAIHFILDNVGTIEGIRKWAKSELSRRRGE
jgi:hypothetical protein